MDKFFTTESLGLLSAGLLVVGILKFILYYKAFNVEILKYIESSEILLLFADNISVAGLAILFLTPPYVYSLMPYLQKGNIISYSFSDLLHTYWVLFGFHAKYQIVLFISAIIFSFTRSKITNFERVTYALLGFFVVLVLPLLALYMPVLIGGTVNANIIVVIMLVVNFFLMIMLATYNEIFKVKNRKYFSNTKVEFDGFSAPSGAYYIGQVKSFIFFYNPIIRQSTTFKTDNIKAIVYKPAFRDRNLMLSFWRKIKRLVS
ncbi:MAG TPA: hypothetical protein VFO93_16825 [Hymenobacter sp.]|uniref:hypothetical protein n=1 Tax=Hymenobacter sp. TaxID=1898978 RepID=UPI002D811157|nr:hypothetical protein [Hymenobacter sp.]HET9505210.1 hypothetical protein [Hymenobacter sp.]